METTAQATPLLQTRVADVAKLLCEDCHPSVAAHLETALRICLNHDARPIDLAGLYEFLASNPDEYGSDGREALELVRRAIGEPTEPPPAPGSFRFHFSECGKHSGEWFRTLDLPCAPYTGLMVWLCGPDSKRTDALTIGSVNYDEESGEFWGFFDRGDEPFFTGEDEAHERRFFEALGFRTTDH